VYEILLVLGRRWRAVEACQIISAVGHEVISGMGLEDVEGKVTRRNLRQEQTTQPKCTALYETRGLVFGSGA
jgi:hypothetical protein